MAEGQLGQSGADLYYAPTAQEMAEAESRFPDLADDVYPAECVSAVDFVAQGGNHSVMAEWKFVIPAGATDIGQPVTIVLNTLLPLPGVEKQKCFQYLNTLRAMGLAPTLPIMSALQAGRGKRVALRVQARQSKPYIDRVTGEERPGNTRSEVAGVLPLPADLPRLLRVRAAVTPVAQTVPAPAPVVQASTNSAVTSQTSSPANWGL